MRKAKEEYESSIKTKMKDVKSKRKHHDDVYRVAIYRIWFETKNTHPYRKMKPKNL